MGTRTDCSCMSPSCAPLLLLFLVVTSLSGSRSPELPLSPGSVGLHHVSSSSQGPSGPTPAVSPSCPAACWPEQMLRLLGGF